MAENNWSQEACPGCYPGIKKDGILTDDERRHLMFKLTRLLEWVGAKVPEHVTINEKRLHLHEIVWDLLNKDDLTDNDRELILSLEQKLEKKFRQDVEEIRHDISEDEAIRDYCEALGLLRAIITLKDMAAGKEGTIGKGDLAHKINERRKNDANDWLAFLKQMMAY